MSQVATQPNLKILQNNNWDLQQILLHDHLSPLCPGSEFCLMPLLKKIFSRHPLWPQFCQTLHQGATLPLALLNESAYLDNLHEAIAYRNQKSAICNTPWLIGILSKEVDKAWQLPLLSMHLNQIPRGHHFPSQTC
jgi:hypothetical protein